MSQLIDLLHPRLFETRPLRQQMLLVTGPSLVFGVVVGVGADLSSAAYLVLILVAIAGGVAAGLEHRTLTSGAVRGLITGLFFGVGVIAGHHLLSRHTSALPHPEIVEVVITSLVTPVLTAIGVVLRNHLS